LVQQAAPRQKYGIPQSVTRGKTHTATGNLKLAEFLCNKWVNNNVE